MVSLASWRSTRSTTIPSDGLCVAALDIAVADENGKASAEQQRDGEADAVAELCARLIGSQLVIDRRSGAVRPCQPGDIALLAPTGTELWRYEEALERRGIPVATQAGKGLFRRQEIQDLIALTRVLADRRDTLALGALLRGPLVGLTEEELLDIVWALPRSEDEPDRIPRLDLGVAPAAIAHPLARETIEKLQALYRRGNSTTPHELLSQAVDVMRVRPLLLERHRGQAERALANVDLYLSLSTGYAVRGLRAFAEAMTAAWTDEARAVEGRPDAQEEAVALFTMHAAKGLEWPIVIPVNTMTGVMAPDSAVIDRQTDTFYCPVLVSRPTAMKPRARQRKTSSDRERIRLWYVAATRARELLVLPRLDTTPSKSAWIGLARSVSRRSSRPRCLPSAARRSRPPVRSEQCPDPRHLCGRGRGHRCPADAPYSGSRPAATRALRAPCFRKERRGSGWAACPPTSCSPTPHVVVCIACRRCTRKGSYRLVRLA